MTTCLLFAALLISWLEVPGGAWQVDEATLQTTQASLESRFREEGDRRGNTLPSWDSYTFQFQGRVLEGRRLVFVNASCTPPPEDAAREWVVAADGGECYFTAYVDPESGVISFQFNGNA